MEKLLDSRTGSIDNVDAAPIMRNRPALRARMKSAPPSTAANAMAPDPMAAPTIKSLRWLLGLSISLSPLGKLRLKIASAHIDSQQADTIFQGEI
jgi:hypothetical protein